MNTLTIRAEQLGPEHLGHDISVPIGLEREGVYLTNVTFRADRDNTGSGFRVVVTGPGRGEYADLASYARVEVYGWDEPSSPDARDVVVEVLDALHDDVAADQDDATGIIYRRLVEIQQGGPLVASA